MKLIPLFLLFLISISSCSKDDTTSTGNGSPSNVSSTLIKGTWRVTYYFDTDHDETSSFDGFNFTFNSNGNVNAANSLFSVPGTWSTLADDNKTKLVLVFSSPAQFQEISDDWTVISRSDTKITLEDPSGGGSGTDKLTFEKN